MVHDELGTPPGQQIHWYFTKTVWGKHVCTVNVCDWLGPVRPGRGGTDTGGIAVWWSVRGCRHVAVDWMGFWGEEHLCFCPVAMWGRGREENLPVWHPNRGSGFLITHSLRSWVQTGSRAGLMSFRSLSLWPGHPPVTVWQELFWCFLVQLLNVQCVM